MTYPRAHIIDQENGGTYQVESRCVRRAWLCGFDHVQQRDFSHRREWIEKRIHFLTGLFAVSVHSYAVMHNHYHIVLTVTPSEANCLSDSDVASRWLQLCPGRKTKGDQADIREVRRQTLLKDPERLTELRRRLSSLSWFMSFINEPIARWANKEDGCTGRFWEGRFSSQIILDDEGLLASMAYVDLNPIRAGLADSLEDSDFTAVKKRLDEGKDPDLPIRPFTSLSGSTHTMSLKDYVALLHWTLHTQRNSRRSGSYQIADDLQIQFDDIHEWLVEVMPRPGPKQRAIGTHASIKSYAKRIGQKWIRKVSRRSSR
jgi:hypothetical protein